MTESPVKRLLEKKSKKRSIETRAEIRADDSASLSRALARFPHLDYAHITTIDNQIDATPLSRCKHLTDVGFRLIGNQPVRLQGLDKIPKLTALRVSISSPMTFSFPEAPSLETIYVGNEDEQQRAPANLSGIHRSSLLASMETYNIDVTSELPHILTHPNIREIEIWNGVDSVDFSPLPAGTKIERIEITQNERLARIDLSPLSRATMLKELKLHFNSLNEVDLAPLSACRQLKVLSLAGNRDLPVIDLAPLSHCTELTNVCVHTTSINEIDLTPIALMEGLQQIDLNDGCKIRLSRDVAVASRFFLVQQTFKRHSVDRY